MKSWALHTGHLSPDDLFISADVDEVMSPSALQQLRWCRIDEEIIFGALWMPLGSLDRAYKIEFHVEGKPHTFGLPTIYKWSVIESGKYDGSRMQSKWKGRRDKYVAGGLHMTHTAYLPNAILKRITATERFEKIGNFFEDIYQGVGLEDLNKQQDLVYTLDYVQDWLFPMLVDPLSSSPDAEPHVPWFLACNAERYPYWHGRADPRNTAFLAALQCSGQYSSQPTKLFIEEGCYDESASHSHTRPCLSGWIKLMGTEDDVAGAAGWGRRVPSQAIGAPPLCWSLHLLFTSMLVHLLYVLVI